MNQTRTIPASTVIASAMWAVTAIVLLAAWILLAAGLSAIALMLGVTAIVSAILAGLAAVRGWLGRLSQLTRALHGIERAGGEGDGLHSIR